MGVCGLGTLGEARVAWEERGREGDRVVRGPTSTLHPVGRHYATCAGIRWRGLHVGRFDGPWTRRRLLCRRTLQLCTAAGHSSRVCWATQCASAAVMASPVMSALTHPRACCMRMCRRRYAVAWAGPQAVQEAAVTSYGAAWHMPRYDTRPTTSLKRVDAQAKFINPLACMRVARDSAGVPESGIDDCI